MITPEGSGDVFKYNWTSLKVQGLEMEHVTEDFKKKVIEVCYELGVNPDDLMSIMAFESGLNPAYKNPDSSASGLIGFMEPTAVDLDTTTDELRKMSAVEQLEYVYKYFKGWNVKTLGDMYMRVLWPRGIGENDDYVLWEKDDQNTSKYYNANSYLDINQDGIVTKKEAYQRIIEQRDSVYK